MGGCMSQPAVYNKVGPESTPLPAGVEVLVRSDAEAAAAAEVLTRAFAGTASAKPEVGRGPVRRRGWEARPTGGLTRDSPRSSGVSTPSCRTSTRTRGARSRCGGSSAS